MAQPQRPPISPRSILKRSPSSNHPSNHGVHFPPSPSLTRVFFAHSSSVYDRSPIIVTPNSCALPERGCPGRTYVLDDPAPPVNAVAPPRRLCTERVLHPRALAHSSYRGTDADTVPPQLIPDTSSSESDESDSFIGPLPEPKVTPISHDVHGLAIHHDKYTPIDIYDGNSAPATPLSFLPHSSYSNYPSVSGASIPKPRRRRERKHESSCDPDRIQSSGEVQEGSSPRSSRAKAYLKYRALTSSFSSLTLNDEGCLGGF
ncbi:hypothetical protein AX16_003388 [Volvariella volvacea WC 439]|nr:hypothetical protein AX16_003388 [Volvariella volvacea WC 439]